MTLTTVGITADTAAATLTGSTDAAPHWCATYFGPWWDTRATATHGRAVHAALDPTRYTALAAQVDAAADVHDAVYARTRVNVAHFGDGVVAAYSPKEEVAYLVRPGERVELVGCEGLALNLAAARLVRELVRAALEADGWRLMHASAVVRGGRAVITLGAKGSGKTTTGLTLARFAGWELLANDRIFVKPAGDGVDVLPYPAANAFGLGLLSAFGDWYDIVRAHRDAMHPTQKSVVTDALARGSRTPLWEDNGHEMKAQIWPHQLATLLGLRLARRATAAMLLFPRIDAHRPPGAHDGRTAVADEDWFTSATEDRYPDVLALRPDAVASAGPEQGRTAIARSLGQLPAASVHLGHALEANAAFLADVIATHI